MFQATGIRTVGDIVFCATVGEEGLGDLRGMKTFFKDHRDIAGAIHIDTPSDVRAITYLGTGSHRYRVTFNGPGGHSFGAFGTPSAIHAMGRAIAKIADVHTPSEPRTTFTVGEVSGGTSVNAIAAKAEMLLDMRSNGQPELLQLEKRILALIQQGADEENARWGADRKITVDLKLIGDRPAGNQSHNSTIVQAAWLATVAVGMQPNLVAASSTNANWTLSLGLPAVTLGVGGRDGATHSPGEWFDPADEYLAPQKIFLTALALVGMDGVSQPLLPAK
jgi:acetylornithine deacetylase/succinyl-diaminopimelate desuccinylase-like protein